MKQQRESNTGQTEPDRASYLLLYRRGELADRVKLAVARLESCNLCPRNCGVNRLKGLTGFCKTGRHVRVASYHPHFGEEAPLVGTHGSGTIFFCGCNLLCSFCQNYEISHLNIGTEVVAEELAEMMLALERCGCHNINFVTPSHCVPQILEALVIAVEGGLSVPLVYNTGGYDSVATLQLLEGVFDIYMPDFKFWDNRWAQELCSAPDYRERAIEAIREMHRQVGDLVITREGVAVRGLLVRHLVMPHGIAGTAEIMHFLADEISRNTYVNVMAQYHPCGTASGHPLLNRPLGVGEFIKARDAALAAGLWRFDR